MKIRIHHLPNITTIVFVVLIIFIAPTKVSATSVSEGVVTNDTDLKIGMLAAFVPASTTETNKSVERASVESADRYIGVVVPKDNATLTSVNTSDDLYVTSSGQVYVFVSDLSGNIAQGDYVAVSPLKGIGSKAIGADKERVVGTALENFQKSEAEELVVFDDTGKQKTVLVDKVLIGMNEVSGIEEKLKKKDTFLVSIGKSITSKPVSEIQIVAAFLILLTIIVIEGSLIYASVYSSILSIGRNPLTRNTIFKQMSRVLILAAGILLIGGAAIYIILWA